MNSGRKLHFWILVFLFVFSIEEAIDAYPQFTCGSHGIKHDINQTGDLPKVTCLTPSQTVYLDVNVQIECEVISSAYANITWLHNGKSLSEKNKSLVKIDRLSCGQTLKIKFAGRDDRGQYTCVATNKFGTVNKTCSLNVRDYKPPPQVEYVKIDGNRQTAYLHGTVTIKCKLLHVEADAWLFNGTRVSHGGRHKMIRETTIAKHERLFALKIINVTEKDEGRYTCLAYRSGISKTKDLVLKTEPCPSCHYCPPEGNQAFPICSSTSPIRLSTSDNDQDPENKDIKHPPQVKYLKIDGKRQTAYLHGTVTLKCKLHHVEGEAWLFNGTRILHDDRHKMMRETTIGKHGGLFTLKIINVTEEDEGLYTCMGYRGGICQTKDLFLKTEPCPRRHHCPPEGNQAFPISLLPSCNRGRSFHRPDPVSILLFAVLAFSSIKCV